MKSFAVDLDTLLTVAVGVLDASGVLLEANAGFLRLLPASCAQPIGAKVTRFFIQPNFATLVAAADQDDHDGYRGLLTIGDSAGKTRTLRGRVWRAAVDIRVLAEYDIGDLERINDAMLELNQESSVAQNTLTRANVNLKQREVQILEASLTDALTGVGNRRKLEQGLATEISRVRRDGSALSAIMTDVDHFKRVNDEYGHGVGDKVLVQLGALLRSQTRQTDIVARFGGEEFIVLMPHTSLAQAAAKAEILRGALAAELIEPLARPVTASFGVAELSGEEDGESFLGRVDKALYRAKEGGRNQVVAANSVQ
jgi:diguanylate cyclase (GGDEF)-like protein